MIEQLVKKVFADPFEYAFGLIMVILAAGWVWRALREQFGKGSD
jgi:hypothetical protein